MKRKFFYIVDVFAEEKYAGNQLAVVRDADGLSAEDMLRIAREFHFSETTFILGEEEKNGAYDVRIFTPGGEVPFAGHPTLGTAYIIRQEIIGKPVREVTLNLKVGRIPVAFGDGNQEPGVMWMKQMPPEFGATFASGLIAGILNITPEEMDSRFPVQEVSTGLPFIIAPLKTLEAVRKCRVDVPRFLDLVVSAEAKAILVFCPETYNPRNDLNVRVFVDYYGIPEDPATGSANGCLAGYLVKHRYFGWDRIDIRVEQGKEIGRPSLLLLRADEKAAEIDVFVGGQAFLVARGELV